MNSTLMPHVKSMLHSAREALERLADDEATQRAIVRAAESLVHAFRLGGKVMACGNGGSMCDSMHLAEELSGRFRGDRPPLAAMAISDPSHLTCTANDYGFEDVFSRWIEAHGRSNDVLVAISTSGRSPNILKAAKLAREKGVKVVALVGKATTELGRLADVEICTPAGRHSDRVQELHIKVIHLLVELVERQMFPQNYE